MQTRTMRRRHAGHRTGLASRQTSFARNMPMRIASRVIPIPWFQSAGIIYTNRTLCHQVRLHIQQSSSRCCSSPYRFVSRTFRRACKIVAIKRASANPRRRDGKTSRTTIQGHNAMCPRRDDFGLAVRPRPIDGGRQTSLPRRSRMNETPGVGSCRRLAFRRERSGLRSKDGGIFALRSHLSVSFCGSHQGPKPAIDTDRTSKQATVRQQSGSLQLWPFDLAPAIRVWISANDYPSTNSNALRQRTTRPMEGEGKCAVQTRVEVSQI